MVHNGIIMVLNRYNGKPKGEAFVQFTSKEDAEKALERHEKTIGKRQARNLQELKLRQNKGSILYRG